MFLFFFLFLLPPKFASGIPSILYKGTDLYGEKFGGLYIKTHDIAVFRHIVTENLICFCLHRYHIYNCISKICKIIQLVYYQFSPAVLVIVQLLCCFQKQLFSFIAL